MSEFKLNYTGQEIQNRLNKINDMDTKANKTDILTLEEIQASSDLSGKIASASALVNMPVVIEVTSLIKSVTINYQFVISLNNRELGIIYFNVYEPVTIWTAIFDGLPHNGILRNFFDQSHTYEFQRHTNGFIQTAKTLQAGSYVIVF